MSRIGNLSVALVLALSVCATGEALAAAPCSTTVAGRTWIKQVTADKRTQAAYLKDLKVCVAEDAKNQNAVDSLAVGSLQVMHKLPADYQRGAANFIMQALQLNAEAGFASSQHNLAALFNAPPRSLLSKLINQDQMKFGYWTRKAAAQGEPRALFNLAMRMDTGVPEAGIEKDPETAYKLLTILEKLKDDPKNDENAKAVFEQMTPAIADEKANIAKAVGDKRAAELAADAAKFDYSTLAPKEAPPPAK